MLFKNTEKDLAAFVVPVFEVRIDDEVPKDKQELLKKENPQNIVFLHAEHEAANYGAQ